jgi:hypothetical protein
MVYRSCWPFSGLKSISLQFRRFNPDRFKKKKEREKISSIVRYVDYHGRKLPYQQVEGGKGQAKRVSNFLHYYLNYYKKQFNAAANQRF